MTGNTTDERYFDPEELRVFRDDSNNLCLEVEGKGIREKVSVRLAFPYSDPDGYVSFVQDGEELGMLEEPARLDEQSRQVLREALDKRYHIPEILKITAVEDAHNAQVWFVETDRGSRRLLVRDRHNFRRIKGGDLIIVDVDGNRFRLARDRKLDADSQRLLDMHG
jgi:hypothetical protein